MSDCIIKIVPKDHRMQIGKELSGQALQYLEKTVTAERITVNFYDTLSFIDCGGNLEGIYCPCCGRELPIDWWGEAMSSAYNSSFADLNVTLPCCCRESSLNELSYRFPCGFAYFEFDILNPASPLEAEHICAVSELLHFDVKIITSHL